MFAENVVTEVPLFQRARAEVLHDDVGLFHQIEEQLAAAPLPQVQRDSSLVAGVHGPEHVVPVDLGLAPGAQRVRSARWLDLDDIGAHVAE